MCFKIILFVFSSYSEDKNGLETRKEKILGWSAEEPVEQFNVNLMLIQTNNWNSTMN